MSPVDALTLADIEAAVAAVAAPLREQLAAVEARERLIVADLAETREMKSRLLQTLRRLDPNMARPGPKKWTGTHGGTNADKERRRREATAAAKKAIDTVASANPDGFTRTRIHEQMKTNGYPIGDARLTEIVASLHESGYLTLHKVVAGGNKSYKRTEDMSNGDTQDPRPAN